MKHQTTLTPSIILILMIASALVLACEDGSIVAPEHQEEALSEALANPDGTTAARGSARSTADVVIMADGSVVGESKLTRTRNGVSYRVQTSGLEPGHAYTLWIVIFNDPDGCVDGPPCGMDDIVNDEASPDMMFAGGNVVGGSGQATFAGRRNVGDLSGSANKPVDVPAYGLENVEGAEIWFVVHDHGPKLSAYLPDMIQTIDGGCTDAGVPEAGVSSPWNDYDGEPGVGAFGERGLNTCASVQVAFHHP